MNETTETAAPALTQEDVLALIGEALSARSVESGDADAADERTELAQREEALRRREARALAEEALAAAGLPKALAQPMETWNREEIEKAVAALEQAFRAAVTEAVEARLQGDAPRAGVLRSLNEMDDPDYYAAVYPTPALTGTL